MTELPPQREASPDRTDIDTASVGLLTIDTDTQAITSCNDSFAAVLGCPAAELRGCLVTDFIHEEVKLVASAVIDGIRAGFISTVDGNVDLVGGDGAVSVDCWILALGTDRPHEVAMAGAIPADRAIAPEGETSAIGFGPTHIDPNRIVLGTLDDEWRISGLAPGAADQLGVPEPSSAVLMPQLQELAHPSDSPTLLGSFGRRSAGDGQDTFSFRLRGPDEQWLSARATVSPLRGHVPPQYGLVLWLLRTEDPGDSESERVSRLEEQLARIRQVVQATDEDASIDRVDLSDLTMRQREIVQKLLNGHRVDAIARDLYVSPSTVRNHLSAIFEKLGVASQSELIELLRDPSTGTTPPGDPGTL